MTRPVMRTRELWREALRNSAVGASRPLLAAVIFSVVALLCGYLAVTAIKSVSQQSHQYLESGATVYRIEAADSISVKQCESLTRNDGVLASGAVDDANPVRFRVLPDQPITTLEISPGALAVFGLNPAGLTEQGAYLSANIAEQLEVAPQAKAELLDGNSVTVLADYPVHEDGRDDTLVNRILAVSPMTVADSCWVLFWPPPEDAATTLKNSLLKAGTEVSVQQWNTRLGSDFNPQQLLQQQPLLPLTLLAAVLCCVAAGGFSYTRRLEHASSLHAGVDRVSLVLITLLETLIWLVPTVCFTVAALAVVARLDNPDPLGPALLAGLRIVLAAAAAWLIGTVLTTVTARESRLFKHFQKH